MIKILICINLLIAIVVTILNTLITSNLKTIEKMVLLQDSITQPTEQELETKNMTHEIFSMILIFILCLIPLLNIYFLYMSISNSITVILDRIKY